MPLRKNFLCFKITLAYISASIAALCSTWKSSASSIP
jgi:hypothetical protein